MCVIINAYGQQVGIMHTLGHVHKQVCYIEANVSRIKLKQVSLKLVKIAFSVFC